MEKGGLGKQRIKGTQKTIFFYITSYINDYNNNYTYVPPGFCRNERGKNQSIELHLNFCLQTEKSEKDEEGFQVPLGAPPGQAQVEHQEGEAGRPLGSEWLQVS